jgi:hypothetical protein
MKTPKKMIRPQFADESWLRATVAAALMQHPLYGHRVATRARNILLDQIMDEVYVEIQDDKERERCQA